MIIRVPISKVGPNLYRWPIRGAMWERMRIGGGARWTRLNARATRPIRLETKSNTHSTARRRLASARYRVGGVRSAHATTPRCRTPCVRDRAPRRCARAPSNAPLEATPTRMTAKHQRTHLFGTVSVCWRLACWSSSCCLLRQNSASPKITGRKKKCHTTNERISPREVFLYGP